MKKETIKRFFLAPRASRLCGARRAAMTLLTTLLLTLTAQTAWATTENLGGYDFTVGTDGEGSYYVIDGTAALNALASYVNAGNNCSGKRFKMTAPITYTGTANNYTPIGDNSHWFSGTFDGQGYTISGININNSSAFHQAIFGFLVGTVKNLVVSDCNIVAQNFIGGIAGQVNSGTIENCHVGSNVSLSAWKFSGGIAGNADGATIKGCTSAATITGVYLGGTNAEYIGGIAGQAAKSGTAHTPYLTDNLFTGAINGSLKDYIGAIVGLNNNASLTNNVYTSTGFGGIGAENSITGADGAGAAKAYELTAAPALLGAATADYGTVKAYGNYGLGYNSKYYLALIPLSETEGMTYLTTNLATATAVPVEFKRTFSNGVASTVCLPFGYTSPGTEGTYYTFSGVSQDTNGKWTATMTASTTTLTANTPYLFVPAADGVVTSNGTCDASATAGTESPSGGDWSFVGTYAAKTWTASETNDYGFAAQSGTAVGSSDAVNAGDFVHLTTGASIKPFRAYLRFTGSTHPWAGSSARRMTRGDDVVLPPTISVVLVSANGDTTEIGTLDTRTGEIISTGDWYSLDGRRLQGKPSTKGIFIHNGRKEVLK